MLELAARQIVPGVLRPLPGSGTLDVPAAPPVKDGIVSRCALFGRLAEAERAVQISAPAGSGKTVLMRSWIAESGLARRTAWVPPGAARGQGLTERLTDSEARVLRFLPTHLTAHEIADELFVSANTVSTHTRHLYAKLGVHTRHEAVARALGLLAPSARRAGLMRNHQSQVMPAHRAGCDAVTVWKAARPGHTERILAEPTLLARRG